MMMALRQLPRQLRLDIEPELYFRVAHRTLAMAQALYRTGLLPRSGLKAALVIASVLGRAGMAAWRARHRHYFR